jgi:hypothetical protein
VPIWKRIPHKEVDIATPNRSNSGPRSPPHRTCLRGKPVAADIEQTRRVARGHRLHFTRTCREPCAVQIRPPVDISGRVRAVNQTSRLRNG